MAPLTRGLGREPFQHPPILGAPVAEAVVKTVLSVVPELDGLGQQPVPAPERRARHVLVLVSRVQLGHEILEDPAALDHLALARRPRAQLAGPGPVAPVALGLLA